MKYTLIDLIAWTLNGLVVGLMLWFFHASYKSATQMGYTPEARAFMNDLYAQYNEPDMSNLKPLTLKDLE